jgi:hypothetical protein
VAGTPWKPIVVRRGSEFVVHNVPGWETFTSAQRAGIGILIWEQVKTLMEANGEETYPPRRVDDRVAATVQVGRSSMYKCRSALNKDGWKYVHDLVAGTLGLSSFWRKSGLKRTRRMKDGPLIGLDGLRYYGKGDHFDEATEPLRRYLKSWEKRGIEFRHIAPREAQSRLRRLNEIAALLQKATEDLESRSHLATSRAPSERKERNT